jgi:hypothetical protein
VLLQKPGKHETSTEGQDGERDRKINEGKPAETHGEENQRDRQDESSHLQPDKPTFRRAMQTDCGAWNQSGSYSTSSYEPEIHGCVSSCAPSRWLILGTLLRSI